MYCSLQNETSQYDIEHNPELEAAVLKWSRNDIQLKIALLAQFFGIYFMPIHTQLLHAVAEDKVFANTIKTICGAQSKREDIINDYGYVECNIKDNTIFRMSNVKTQTTNDTVYGITFNHPNYVEGKYFGVDLFPSDITVTDDETHIKELLTHYYTGPGVVIPFEMTITNQMAHDFLKLTVVEYTNENGEQQCIHLYDKIDVVDNKIHINFNFLAKTAQNYLLKFTFILGSSRTLNKTIKFITFYKS